MTVKIINLYGNKAFLGKFSLRNLSHDETYGWEGKGREEEKAIYAQI